MYFNAQFFELSRPARMFAADDPGEICAGLQKGEAARATSPDHAGEGLIFG
jgi:hypothetical protein